MHHRHQPSRVPTPGSVTVNGHLPTCTPYCAVTHCWCGALASHGERTCSSHHIRGRR